MARTKRLTTSGSQPDRQRLFAFTMAVLIFGWSGVKLVFLGGMEKWHELIGPSVNVAAVADVDWQRTPPRPQRYVTDLAGVLDADRASKLNETLAQFERQTSNQLLIYVARSVPDGTSMEEVATASFAEWGIGQRGKNNGVLFMVFTDDHTMRIEVGYGLEGALTDAKARRITSTVVKPFFKEGDYTGGVEAGARAIMAVVRGEASGDGQTFAEQASVFGANIKHFSLEAVGGILVALLVGALVLLVGTIASKVARLFGVGDPFAGGGSSGSWSGSGSSSYSSSSSSFSSSSSSSSSSSFSGGGGSSGGGGASDSW